MEILRDEEAINYLSRAEACLHPEIDNFGSIPLLARLISLEKVFLTRLVAKGQKGMPLLTGDYGLPELSAWRVDISKAFEEVGVIRANRAQALAPVLQEINNAFAEGVDEKFAELERALVSDTDLLKALEVFSPDEEEFLTQKWDSSPSFPFYTDKFAPGLLLSKSDRTPFSERRGTRKRFDGIIFRPGFKYIDALPDDQRAPLFMMVAFSTERKTLGFRLITGEKPLLARSGLMSAKAVADDPTRRYQSDTTVEYYDLSHSKTPQDTSLVAKFEDTLQNLRPAFFRALHQTDYTGKSSFVEVYFGALFELNELANLASQFSKEVLELKPMSAEEARQTKITMATKLRDIYNSVADNELRRRLQLTMAEELNQTRDVTEAAKVRTSTQRSLFQRWSIFGKK